MLLTPLHLWAAMFASDDTTRPALRNILVCGDGTVYAADGAVAVRVSGPLTRPDDFPIIPGLEDYREPEEPVQIPADVAICMAKLIPKGRLCRATPVLGNAVLLKGEAGYVLATTNLQTPTITTIEGATDEYPNVWPVYRGAVKAPMDHGPVRFNLDLWCRIAKYRAMFKEESWQTGSATILPHGDGNATEVRWECRGLLVHVLIMPLRPL